MGTETLAARCVVRVLLKSEQRAPRTMGTETLAARCVVRVLLESGDYFESSHLMLVGSRCSHCMVSVTPDVSKPQALD